jgi:hypothetical protein
MTLAVQTDLTLVKPLEGAIVRRYTTGAAVTAGSPVALDSSGYVQHADGNSSDPAADMVLGITLQTAAAAAERVDVVVFGPVSCMTGATPGAYTYISDTVALPDHTSTSNGLIGIAESATVLFVRPQKP